MNAADPKTAAPARDGAAADRPKWRDVWGLRVFANPAFVRLALSGVLAIALAYRIEQYLAFVGSSQWGYDFSAYWLAGRHLLAGESIYRGVQLAGPYEPQHQGQFLYLYPPFLAVLVMPLAWLVPSSYGPAMGIWSAIGIGITASVVAVIARLEGIGAGAWGVAVLVAAAFAFPPVVAELVLGNVHLLLLGLFGLAWLGIRRGSCLGEVVAGGAVGAAALIKLFPVLLIVWFVLTGRRTAVGAAVLAAAALAVATLPITGIQAWLDYPRAIANLGTPADTTDALAPSLWLTGLLSPTVARALVIVVGAVAVGFSARLLDERASYGIAVSSSVLLAPSVFQHYLAIMVLPLMLGVGLAATATTASRVALAASYLAMWPGQQPLLGAWSWVLNRGLPSLGAIGVPVSLITSSRRRRDSGPPRT